MFELDPLSRPVAIVEMLLLLTVAAVVGWLIARLILNGRINAVRSAIASQEAALADCSRSKISALVPKRQPVYATSSSTAATVVPIHEPVELEEMGTTNSLLTDAPLALAPERPFIEPILPEPVLPATAGNSETAVLQRIAARAGELNFERIGLATAAEADDLKDIVGIGPFLERKLHGLGIYTFRQIANFVKEDMAKVNEIIEFFPGRIERDDWVGQSKAFYKRKYGQ